MLFLLAESAEICAEKFIQSIELERKKLQRGAIAIVHKDRVIYQTTWGVINGEKITENTLFPLASVSKSVIASSLALMISKGQLNLYKKYQLPYLKHKITLQHILGHTTGYTLRGDLQVEQGNSHLQLLRILKKQKPSYNPGFQHAYSNIMFSLVEEILHLEETNLENALTELNHLLHTNDFQFLPLNKSAVYLKTPNYTTAVAAAGGVFSSLAAMIKLFQWQFNPNNRVMQPFYQAYKKANYVKNYYKCDWDNIDSYYGLGFRILKRKDNPTPEYIFHSGYLSGASTFIGYLPHQNMGIIILISDTKNLPNFAFQNGLNFWRKIRLCQN